MPARKRKQRRKPTRGSRERALKELLHRMEADPGGVVTEVREWVEREEQKERQRAADWERFRKEQGWDKTDPDELLRKILREAQATPEGTVRLIGICGRLIFEKLERWRATK